ncbi:chromogranin-A isoform X2 [Polyodon spathula]|uniref:chromogranin-A isoform X2 n=1 Tax=Polyodon spathula TaxID=7913 RepID=UPI001B7E1D7F|nr:chromogranin-A isoform X2 [Polyodon spathula]
MLTRGCLILTFFVYHAFSLPISSDHEDKEKAKVMKCIVEVIADTLSKPSPLPVSQECLDALRGDDRIISIIRHQNLLKELQELAAEGTSERAQKQKKSSNLADHISGVLHNDKDAEADQSMLAVLGLPKSSVDKEEKRDESQEEEKKDTQLVKDLTQDSAESLQDNELEQSEKDQKREDTPDNHITDSVSKEVSVSEEKDSTQEEPEDTREEPSKPDKERERSSQEEEETENETKEEQRLHKDSSESDYSKNISEEDKDEKISKKEDSEEDKKSSEDKMESLKAGEESLHGNVAEREEKSSKAEVEGESKWLNKMDELAEQLSSKKRFREEEKEENSTERLQAPLPNSPLLDGDLRRHLTAEKHYSKEASVEEDGARSFEPTELQMMHHPDVEEKREEEGSANRKPEEDIESLAAIETELEDVAQKLHEIQRG